MKNLTINKHFYILLLSCENENDTFIDFLVQVAVSEFNVKECFFIIELAILFRKMRSGCPGLLYGNNLALFLESPKVLKGKLGASEGALKSEGSNTTTIMMISREMA